MPIYEYKGQQYDIATTDKAEAKAKILKYLGEEAPAPAPAAKPAPAATKEPEERPMLGSPMGEDLASAIRNVAGERPTRTYTGSVFDTVDIRSLPEEFDPAEAARLSRREYAARTMLPPRRPSPVMKPIPEVEQRPRTLSEKNFDVWAGALQGGAGFVKGILDNLPGGGGPVSDAIDAVTQGLERLKTPQLKSSQIAREGRIARAREVGGEGLASKVAFETLLSPAGADIMARGGGSIIPTLGMSFIGLGAKALTAANMLSNAGSSAVEAQEQLKQLSPEQWSKHDVYQSLRAKGLSHRDAVNILAPIYAVPAQLTGAGAGYVSGTTGLEKALTRGTERGMRAAAGRFGAEIAGEEFESLAPQFVSNLVAGTLNPKISPTQGLGVTAVETAAGAVPGAALAALPSKRRNVLNQFAQQQGYKNVEDYIRQQTPKVGQKAVEDRLIEELDKEADAQDAADQQQAEGVPSATRPITPAGRAGVSVAGEPGAGVATKGVAGAQRPRVVPARPDVADLAGREGAAPGAIEPTLEGELPPIQEGRIEPTFEAAPAPTAPAPALAAPAEPQTLTDYLEGLPNSKYYADLSSRDPSKIENDDIKTAYWALDGAAHAIELLKQKLSNLDHPAVTGKTPAERAAGKATAPLELRELLNLPSSIAGTASRIVNQAQALEKGYKGAKAGSREKIDAAAKELENDFTNAVEKLLKYNLLNEEERAEAEQLLEERKERRAIQEETAPVAEPVSDEDIPFEPTQAAPAPTPTAQPVTVESQKRTKDEFGNAATEVKLSNGNTYTLQRLNAAESMGLPGWHYAGVTTSDILGGSFLGNTKEEAIQELIRRESEKRPPAETAVEPPQKAPPAPPTPPEPAVNPEVGESTTPPPVEDTPYYGSEEINALGNKIKDTANQIASNFMVGDMVRYGTTNGTVVGIDGEYAKVHPDGAKSPKAYYRIPMSKLTLIARPDTVAKTAAMANPGEDKKFGVEQGNLGTSMGNLVQLLGANMYASSVAEVAVKELLQNAFDAVKGAVSSKKSKSLYKYGEVTITFDASNRTITVTDNARGMTPAIVRDAFFTIAGSDKSDLEPSERSGGFGFAKMGFMLGSERLILDTVRDGVRVRVDTSAKDIANNNFQIVKTPAPKEEHGTSVTIQIPEYYYNEAGDKKDVFFSSNPKYYDVLKKPLIGPVVVKTIIKDYDEVDTLPLGLNFPADKYITFKVNFEWGSADIYFSKERNTAAHSFYIKHEVLSSGVYQFNTDFNLNQQEKIPYDIIVNIKPNVIATHIDYPFNNNREGFKGRLKEDIASLNAYLAQIARGNEAQDLQENFKNIVSMPRTEAGQDIADASRKLHKAFDQRGAAEKRELPPMPSEVRIEGTRVIAVDTGKVVADRTKKEEKERKGTFQAEQEAPPMEDFLLKMEQNPKLPIFHNNTNTDLLEIGRQYGEPERFFAELGTLMVEMKEALADSGLHGYEALKPENLFFGGVSIDKQYGGVHIKVPYKAVLVNPFYDFGAKTLFGVREYLWETMTHEIAHTGDMGHGVGHNTHMLKVRQYLADQGLADYFRDALMDVLMRHESTFTAMREAYGRSTTKNTGKSLKDYEKGSASISDGSAASRSEDAVRALPTGGGPGGYGDLRPSGPINPTSGVSRATGDTAPDSVKGLNQDVVDAINRNDVGATLRAIARTTSGLYAELARRLAELNLPTNIIFNNERALVYQTIVDRSAQQQIRLFAYLSRVAPDFYSKYFKDYDKPENLERVYEGLGKLASAGIDTRPVATELADVQHTFDKAMPGLTAPGFFVPGMDTINIRPDVNFGSSNRTVLHEIVHAATDYMLHGGMSLTAEQQEAVADLYEMYEYAQRKLPPGEYGFTNISEFVAEAMTNTKFQAKLKSVPYRPQKTTLFNSFVRFVANLLGLDNLAGATAIAVNEIFSAQRPAGIVKPAPLRFAPPQKRVRGPISKPDSWRTAESVQTSIKDTIIDATKGRVPLNTALKDLAGALWSANGTAVRATVLPVLQLRQLKDLTRTKFPQIVGAVDIIEKMVAYRGQKIRRAEKIVQDWSALQSKYPKQSALMSRIMIEATIRARDPDYGPPAGAKSDALDNAWNALRPEFKTLYRNVREFYADSIKEMVRTMKIRALGLPKAERQAMIRKIDDQFGPNKLVYPYFPLRRFGTHWFQVGKGNFKEFYTFESAIGRNLAFNKRRRALMAGNAQQKAAAETMRMGNGISELYSQNIATTQVLRDLEETIDGLSASSVPDIKAEIKDSLNQLVYLLLPQQSMRKMFINRRAIQGASSDMLRVFAHSAVHSAYQQSRFKFAEPFVNNIQNARSYIDELETSKATTPQQAAVYRDYVIELEKRTKNILGIEDTSPVARTVGAITGTTFYFMLSAPASALLNVIGATQFAMPRIGAKYGYAKTNALLTKNFGRYLGSTPKRTLAPAAQGNFLQISFPSIVEGWDTGNPVFQRAAARFVDDGDINISMTNDIFDLGEQPSALYTGTTNNVKKVLAGGFHQAERFMREVTLLTAFELAYDKFLNEPRRDIRGVIERDPTTNKPLKYTPDEAFELAIQDARDIAGLTLGDYTRQMKGRVFTVPTVNLLTQFKQYAIAATYNIFRDLYVTVGAPFRTAEIEQFRKQMIADGLSQTVIDQRLDEAENYRKELHREGMKRLAGVLGMTFLWGGIVAQPFFSMLGTIIKMFAPDDDDEFFDWENWFYNYVIGEVGGAAAGIFKKMGVEAGKSEEAGHKLGVALARGPVAAVTGASLSDRVSLDLMNLWWREGRYAPDMREALQQEIIANLGPSVGLGLNWADAWQLASEGQWGRAFEKAAPAMFARPATAYRLGTEGATTRGGEVIGGLFEFTTWELAMQSIGLQPERLALAQKAAIQAKTYQQKIVDQRNSILNRLWMERGTPGFADAMQKANDFNMRYPELVIDGKAIENSFDARAEAKAQAEAIGAKLDEKLLGKTAPMLRYGVQ